MTRRWTALSVALAMAAAGPLTAQEEERGPETYARRGMVIGAVTGGIVSGAGLGLLASALCESGQGCDGAFTEGFVLGLVAGGVAGGLAGLVIGAAIPRPEQGQEVASPGTPPGPWQARLGGGPRWSGPGDVEGAGFHGGVAVMRPTSPSIRWGMEASYLAGDALDSRFSIRDRDGNDIAMRNQWDRDLWTVSLVAARVLHPGERFGPYLMASVGVYPLQEDLSIGPEDPASAPEVISIQESGIEAYPGVGVGAGGGWRVSDRVGVGAEGRFHLVIGAGDGLGLPVATLAGSLLLGF